MKQAVLIMCVAIIVVGLGSAAMADDFGIAETFGPEWDDLAPMETVGLVEITGSRIRITEKGRPLMRTVAAVFDRYLETGGARHSQAV